MTKKETVARLVRERTQECLALQAALFSSDDAAMHRFRLACKRLRFLIERFEIANLEAAAAQLGKLTDELGAARDCVVLAKRARKLGAGAVAWRAQQERGAHVKRGRAIWTHLSPLVEQRTA